MKTTTPTAFHRRLLSEAWQLAWQRKSLWVFGLFAGVVASGSTMGLAFSGLAGTARVSLSWTSPTAWKTVFAPIFASIVGAARSNPERLKSTLTFAVVFSAAYLVWSFVCEGGLIEALTAKNTPTISEAAALGWRDAFHLFVLTLAGRVVQLILSLLAGLSLAWFALSGSFLSAFVAILALLAFIPLTTAVYTIVILASIHAVRKQTHAVASLSAGWFMFSSQWLAAFETGFVLLVIDGLCVITLTILTVILFVPAALAFQFAQTSGWLLAPAVLGAVTTLVYCTLLFASAGLITAFRFAVWTRFYERAVRPLTAAKIVAKLKRWFHPMHVAR